MDNQIPFSIFKIGNVSPFASGSSTSPPSTYPCLRYSGTQRRAHLTPRKALHPRRSFAHLQQPAPDPAPGPSRMHKESPNLGRLCSRIEQRVVALRPMIAPVRSSPPRPSSARRQHAWPRGRLNDIIGPVRDQLRVQPQPCPERLIDLRRRILLCRQSAHRRLDQGVDARDVVCGRQPELKMTPDHQHHGIVSFLIRREFLEACAGSAAPVARASFMAGTEVTQP